MRLHRLEVTAFGPYADTQVVDFDALNESGVFLMTGPTGAGKTSILDAVCYALYSVVPGDREAAGLSRQGRRQVHGHHLPDAAGAQPRRHHAPPAKVQGMVEAQCEVVQPVQQPVGGFLQDGGHLAQARGGAVAAEAVEAAVEDLVRRGHAAADGAKPATAPGGGAGRTGRAGWALEKSQGPERRWPERGR